jgi:hypothetical protein
VFPYADREKSYCTEARLVEKHFSFCPFRRIRDTLRLGKAKTRFAARQRCDPRSQSMKSEPPTPEFQKFKKFMTALVAVPHSEIKKKIDTEKAARKRKRAAKASASRAAASV